MESGPSNPTQTKEPENENENDAMEMAQNDPLAQRNSALNDNVLKFFDCETSRPAQHGEDVRGWVNWDFLDSQINSNYLTWKRNRKFVKAFKELLEQRKEKAKGTKMTCVKKEEEDTDEQSYYVMAHVPTQASSDGEDNGEQKKPKKETKKPIIKQNVFTASWDLFNSNF